MHKTRKPNNFNYQQLRRQQERNFSKLIRLCIRNSSGNSFLEIVICNAYGVHNDFRKRLLFSLL